MKKFLLLSFLIGAAVNSFAFVTQGHWRWRKDDGSETAATWMSAQDAGAVISSASDNFRLRMQFYNEGTGNTDMNTTILVYSKDGGTTWDSVSNVVGSRAFVLAGSSSFVNNLDPTTQQLTAQGGYSFTAGQIITSSSTLGLNNIVPKAETEYEWVIKPTANVQPSTTYLFKADTKPGDNTYDGSIPAASLTTSSVLPIKFAGFSVQQDGKLVKIQWSTVSETNNDRFEVERSADGRTWNSIATVKGNGSSSTTQSYSAYDNVPLKGTNYYRIRQYDADGKSFVSDTRSLRILLDSRVVVFPNPTAGPINFNLQDYSGTNVKAVLSNNSGKVIYTQVFAHIDANTKYVLNMPVKPAPGIYFLKLSGDNLSETAKVVVR